MMENRKKNGLIIIAISILLLIIIVLLFIKKNQSTINEPVATTTTSVIGTLIDSNDVVTPTSTPGDKYRNPLKYDVSKEAPYEENVNDVAQTAALFATRLGNFSNESDYSNFTDLKIFMTPSMSDWADKHVADLRSQEYSGEYYGITTNKLFTKVLSYDEKAGKAKVTVTTERREDRGSVIGASFKQNMLVDLVKDGDSWLVDNAVWEK